MTHVIYVNLNFFRFHYLKFQVHHLLILPSNVHFILMKNLPHDILLNFHLLGIQLILHLYQFYSMSLLQNHFHYEDLYLQILLALMIYLLRIQFHLIIHQFKGFPHQIQYNCLFYVNFFMNYYNQN